jgi:hypothetical protein
MMSHDAELESSPSVHHHADDGEHAATLTETLSVGASIDRWATTLCVTTGFTKRVA